MKGLAVLEVIRRIVSDGDHDFGASPAKGLKTLTSSKGLQPTRWPPN